MELSTLKNKRRVRLTTYAPLIIWIGVILLLGSSEGSMERTSRFIRPILEFIFPLASEETLILYHGYIRKFAHVAEYAVLGFLAGRTFVMSAGRAGYLPFGFAVVLPFLVAMLDELAQSLDPSRTGSTLDVLIDSVGGLIGAALYIVASRRRYTPDA